MTYKVKIFIAIVIAGLIVYLSVLEQVPDWSPRTWIMMHGKGIRTNLDILDRYHFKYVASNEPVQIFKSDFYQTTFAEMSPNEQEMMTNFCRQYPDLVMDSNGYYFLPLKGFSKKPFGIVFRGYRTHNGLPDVHPHIPINNYTELFGDWFYYKVNN